MKERLENTNPLAELIRSQREEIESYRWIESEKAGRDIGWKRASEEWKRNHFVAWKRSLRDRGILHPLFEVLWSQQQEIESYKWIESEKRGHDIGWKRAVTEWQDRHYGEWKTHVMLGSPDDGSNTKGMVSSSAPRKTKRTFSEEHRQKLALAMQAWHGKRKSRGASRL
jgi:hypothetical protein